MDGLARQISIVIHLLQKIQQMGKRRQAQKILEALARHLEDNELINLEECFIDGTFVVAKKGGKSWKDQAGQRYEAHGYC